MSRNYIRPALQNKVDDISDVHYVVLWHRYSTNEYKEIITTWRWIELTKPTLTLFYFNSSQSPSCGDIHPRSSKAQNPVYGGSNPQSRISTHVRVFADFFAADFGFALFCLFFGSFLLPFWFQNEFDSSHYFYFYFIFNYSFLFHFLFDLLFIFTLTWK